MRSRSRFAVISRKTAVREFARSSTSGPRNFRASSLPGSAPARIMTTGHETIQLRLEHLTAGVTLDRPPLNLLCIPMMQGLGAALGRALPKSDFLIFRGAGSQAFLAG